METKGDIRMKRRKASRGEKISSIIFFFATVWFGIEGQNFYKDGSYIKCAFIYLGAFLSLLAAFRFQIQYFVEKYFQSK